MLTVPETVAPLTGAWIATAAAGVGVAVGLIVAVEVEVDVGVGVGVPDVMPKTSSSPPEAT